MENVSRRSALYAGGVGITGILAGCTSLLGWETTTDDRPSLEVFLVNETNEDVIVSVYAYRDGEQIFEHTYHLQDGKADESEAVTGTPTELQIDVRDETTVRQRYSVPTTCESPEINIWVWPDEINVNNGCV